jgi:hypothetical protein
MVLNKSDSNDVGSLTTTIYLEFCESDPTSNRPLQQVWHKLQELYGPIEIGSPIETLFLETIRYTLETLPAALED